MDLPPELLNAIYIGIAAIIAAVAAFIVALFVGGRYLFLQFSKIKVEQARIATNAIESQAKIIAREAAADTKREEIINKMFVDFNEQLKDKQAQIDKQNEKYGGLREDLAESRGKISVLLDYRSELTKKIEKLERRIAELEHDKNSMSELITTLRMERDKLKRRLEARDKLIIDKAGIVLDLRTRLKRCEEEKESDKVVKLPQPKQDKPIDKENEENLA